MLKTIFDERFTHRKVLIRVDFNVPTDENFKITDDTRITESLTTINKIIDDGGIPILMSHLGRPKGARNPKYSLKPVADYLENHFGYDVIFAEDCIGEPAEKAVKKAEIGQLVLLENLRFYREEEKNDPVFAKKLSSLGDCYVNDAFGTAHRAHASTAGIAEFFTDKFAGKLILDELEYLGKAVQKPSRPFTAILGGSKISGKIDVINNLMDKCDNILIGGGMMFTFLKAMDLEIGKSLLEEDRLELAKDIINRAKEKNINLVLPSDTVIADKFAADANSEIVSVENIPNNKLGMDIGSETISLFSAIISQSKTVIWNGPMGVFEMDKFAKGTFAVAEALAAATTKGAITIVGGGDSAAAIAKMNFKRKVTHVSTGGGASLEFLEGKVLPGIKALEI